jgi:UDP-N-acetylmuramate dehydrogenase
MMADSIYDSPDFMTGLTGRLLVNEPMSRHTSWRTGGIADYFYTPADKADLILLLKKLPQQIPVYWVGLGSNLLVRDGGFQGMVIRTSKGLDAIEVKSSNRLYVESGVSCAKVARVAARNSLKGVEFLAGVPGSFGGALAMNAGAFGGETWQWVERIECVDRKGKCSEIASMNVKFGYRYVDLPENHWILAGVLALEKVGGDYDGKDKIRSLLDQRGASQPIQSANAGSVFKNPPGDFAARLIEEAGLKGREIGGAAISSIHANFIVNKGNATSGDIERLIQISRDRVMQHSGIALDLEVRVIGSAE